MSMVELLLKIGGEGDRSLPFLVCYTSLKLIPSALLDIAFGV